MVRALSRRKCAVWYRAAAVGATLVFATSAAADQNLEYTVKAAYLYKFGAFVQWPETAFASPSSSVRICVAGADPFGDALDKAVENKQINERPIEVQRLKTVSRDSGCHILFVSGSDGSQHANQVLESTKGAPTLSVTDASLSAGKGEVIHFVIVDNRVRFEIDEQTAADNGLMISSKLLSVALSVKTRK